MKENEGLKCAHSSSMELVELVQDEEVGSPFEPKTPAKFGHRGLK